MLTSAGANQVLNELDAITFMSLHSAYSVDGTAFELTGGSPVYARQPVTFTSAVAGSKSMTAIVTFAIPPASTVAWVGLWAGGTLYAMIPNGGINSNIPTPFVMDDTSSNVLHSASGVITNLSVVVWGGGYALPSTGGGHLSEGTIYYCTPTGTNAFTLSLISGGAALDFSVAGQGYWQTIDVLTFVDQSTFRVNSLTFTTPGVS